MKNILLLIFITLSLSSCQMKDEFDFREAFKINRNLNCGLLIEKGYTRIYGQDVVLIGKQTGDTIVYYQLEYPIQEFLEYSDDSEQETLPLDFKPKELCDGTINWRNFELKLDSIEAFNFKKRLDTIKFKLITSNFEWNKYDYARDRYRVVNLIDKDTFNCSITKRNSDWIFSSIITIAAE